MSQHVARHMVERGGGGKIVFISSVHARKPYARSVAYNAAKAGLNHMAFTIAAELAPHRINVNVIEPGWIDTPGEHETFGDEAIAEAGPKLPWGRLGRPEDIGKAAVFLASDDADYITGTALLVDGGFLLRESLHLRNVMINVRRDSFHRRLLAIVVLALSVPGIDASPWAAAAARPNVVFILADDLGYLRPRLLRRRDRDAEPRSPWRRAACGSRSSTTPRGAGRRGRRC